MPCFQVKEIDKRNDDRAVRRFKSKGESGGSSRGSPPSSGAPVPGSRVAARQGGDSVSSSKSGSSSASEAWCDPPPLLSQVATIVLHTQGEQSSRVLTAPLCLLLGTGRYPGKHIASITGSGGGGEPPSSGKRPSDVSRSLSTPNAQAAPASRRGSTGSLVPERGVAGGFVSGGLYAGSASTSHARPSDTSTVASHRGLSPPREVKGGFFSFGSSRGKELQAQASSLAARNEGTL